MSLNKETPSTTPLVAGDGLTAAQCEVILNEVATLLQALWESSFDQERLNGLLSKHFQENALGKDFRSICCYGRKGLDVSLDIFNQLCILPKTQWKVRLSKNAAASQEISHSILNPADSLRFIVDSFSTASKNDGCILLDVLHCYPPSQAEFLLSLIPAASGIPTTWTLAILGLKHKGSTFTLPSIPTLCERIHLSVELGRSKKLHNARYLLFCPESDSAWQSIYDSFDIDAIYLKACSDFPAYLQTFLSEKKCSLDKLAGVEPSQRYPKVEAIVEDAFTRAKLQGLVWKDLHFEDGTFVGTVMAMHNGFVSPAWLAAYLVDTDNNQFMTDVRDKAMSGKDRLQPNLNLGGSFFRSYCFLFLFFGSSSAGAVGVVHLKGRNQGYLM
jgi:hypothetical protein